MGNVRELCERLWSGSASTDALHPFTTFAGLEEYGDGLAFVSSFANVSVVRTEEGLVLIDTGSPLTGQLIHGQIREWNNDDLRAVLYTHGHIDHVQGVWAFEQGARVGSEPFKVYANPAIRERFARYQRTAGYNGTINARQFRQPGLTWPTAYRFPDEVVSATTTITVGKTVIEMHPAKGETDDHLWVWLPQHRAVCTGDLFIWAAPNCGNPQKAQRYPLEQAQALEEMRALRPAVLFPGHGPAIEGEERVCTALEETARLLRFLHDETLALMNEGASLDQVLATVRAPEELLQRPYLRPVYDEPEFVVRNVWRLYGGWWDGNPARLKPPRDHSLAAEVVGLAGSVEHLLHRAQELGDKNELALACQLVEWAVRAAPEHVDAKKVRSEIYSKRASQERSLMASSIFVDAANNDPR